ncbi:uncharacterized protein [Clytia hemisphaerica]|uniref:Uncharacterized protein n=1 Tax=Clytia hemisphaerica TaxID=252671 RepID=A0A7M5V812_9CNID|eukprot:TCONS_00070246-protein
MKIALLFLFVAVAFAEIPFDEIEEEEGSGHVSCRHEFRECAKDAEGDRQKFYVCLAKYFGCKHDERMEKIKHCIHRCYQERQTCRSFRFICDMRLRHCKYNCYNMRRSEE